MASKPTKNPFDFPHQKYTNMVNYSNSRKIEDKTKIWETTNLQWISKDSVSSLFPILLLTSHFTILPLCCLVTPFSLKMVPWFPGIISLSRNHLQMEKNVTNYKIYKRWLCHSPVRHIPWIGMRVACKSRAFSLSDRLVVNRNGHVRSVIDK